MLCVVSYKKFEDNTGTRKAGVDALVLDGFLCGLHLDVGDTSI